MHIRAFRNGDETALRAIFYSSVHALACKDYTAGQLDAWAPRQYDAAQWGERVRGNQPFIAEIDGHIAGYADLQAKEAMVAGVIRLQDSNAPPKTRRYLPHWA